MAARSICAILAFSIISTSATALTIKPNLVGTWVNSNSSPRCEYFPVSVAIKSASDVRGDIETSDRDGHVHVWTDEQAQVFGPATGPDLMNLRYNAFTYKDGKLRYTQFGPDGADVCMFDKAGPEPHP